MGMRPCLRGAPAPGPAADATGGGEGTPASGGRRASTPPECDIRVRHQVGTQLAYPDVDYGHMAGAALVDDPRGRLPIRPGDGLKEAGDGVLTAVLPS